MRAGTSSVEMDTAEHGDPVHVNLLGLYSTPATPENGKSHAISKFKN